MDKSLRTKAVIILAVILICIYGMIGLPKSKDELVRNWNQNIKLGLDLRGGSHLVLQVQVQDAFIAEAQQIIEGLKDELSKAGVTYSAIDNTEPKTIEQADQIAITIRGVPPEKAGTLRTVVQEKAPTWTMSSAGQDYVLKLPQTEAIDLRRRTVQRAISTIETRVNGLGLAESAVQPRGRQDGEGEILVQLPGVDDPARIKQILQTAAVLELYEVKDGPFASEEEARAKHGGVLPLNTKLIQGQSTAASNTGWLLVTRTPVIRGADLRDATRCKARPVPGKYSSCSRRTPASASSGIRKRISATVSRSCSITSGGWPRPSTEKSATPA